jgi:hypothetical protein
MDEEVAIASESFERTKLVPLAVVRLLTASDVDDECVMMTPLRFIWASSDDVGTCWSLGLAELTQLLATSQSPPLALIHNIVARRVRSSSRLTTGRNRRRITGDEARGERKVFRRMRDSPELKIQMDDEMWLFRTAARTASARTHQGPLFKKAIQCKNGRQPHAFKPRCRLIDSQAASALSPEPAGSGDP